MAARRWIKGFGSLYHNPVSLWCHVTGGAAGAVGAFAGRGIFSVTKLGAGRYRFTLDDAYRGLLCAVGIVECAADNVDFTTELEAHAVGTAGGGTIDMKTKTGAVSTDLVNGDDLWVRFDLMNSSVDVVI